MRAEITKAGRRYLAWCEACQDGLRDSHAAATEWAATHNRKRHSE